MEKNPQLVEQATRLNTEPAQEPSQPPAPAPPAAAGLPPKTALSSNRYISHYFISVTLTVIISVRVVLTPPSPAVPPVPPPLAPNPSLSRASVDPPPGTADPAQSRGPGSPGLSPLPANSPLNQDRARQSQQLLGRAKRASSPQDRAPLRGSETTGYSKLYIELKQRPVKYSNLCSVFCWFLTFYY